MLDQQITDPNSLFIPTTTSKMGNKFRQAYLSNLGMIDLGQPLYHYLGYLTLPRANGTTERLAVNVVHPHTKSHGVVFLVHGHKSRALDLIYSVIWFTSQGWTVTTLDLPGHGLSEGLPRSDIDDFSHYGDALAVWMKWVQKQEWGTSDHKILMAHSLGTAASLEFLKRDQAPKFEAIIFCAPLLKINYNDPLGLVQFLFGGIYDFVSNKANPEVHWLGALQAWLPRLDKQKPLDLPLTIYNGTNDQVVDINWNTKKYQSLVPRTTFFSLPNQDHWFVDHPGVREDFHKILWQHLIDQGVVF